MRHFEGHQQIQTGVHGQLPGTFAFTGSLISWLSANRRTFSSPFTPDEKGGDLFNL